MDDLKVLKESHTFLSDLYNKYEQGLQKYTINWKNKLWKYYPYILIFQTVYFLGVSYFFNYSFVGTIMTFLIGIVIDIGAVNYSLNKDRLQTFFEGSKEIAMIDQKIIKEMKGLFQILKICSDKGWIDSYELDKWIKNVENIQEKKQNSSEIWKEIHALKEHIDNILNEKQKIAKRELFLNELQIIKTINQEKEYNELNHKDQAAQINFKELL